MATEIEELVLTIKSGSMDWDCERWVYSVDRQAIVFPTKTISYSNREDGIFVLSDGEYIVVKKDIAPTGGRYCRAYTLEVTNGKIKRKHILDKLPDWLNLPCKSKCERCILL